MSVTSQNTVMVFPGGARQIPTSKMAFLTKNKVTVTRAGAEAWRIIVLKSLERAQRLPGKLISLHEYKGDRFGNHGSESKGMIKVFSKRKAKDAQCERLLTELRNIKHFPTSPCRTCGIGVQSFLKPQTELMRGMVPNVVHRSVLIKPAYIPLSGI